MSEQTVTYDEAIKIVENFPWESEREKIVIDLTNPSVTFQSNVGYYLKLAVYYNKKNVLYYFNGKHLYTKSLLRLGDSYSFIENFFGQGELDIKNLKKELTPFKNLAVHFISQDFRYTTEGKTFFALMDIGTKILLAGDILFLFSIQKFFYRNEQLNIAACFGALIFVFFYGGINLWLVINYALHSKKKVLQLSKGSDSFYFGPIGSPMHYQKQNVYQILITKTKSSRCPWGDFTFTSLFLKNGEVLEIPSLLLEGNTIARKFPNHISVIENMLVPLM